MWMAWVFPLIGNIGLNPAFRCSCNCHAMDKRSSSPSIPATVKLAERCTSLSKALTNAGPSLKREAFSLPIGWRARRGAPGNSLSPTLTATACDLLPTSKVNSSHLSCQKVVETRQLQGSNTASSCAPRNSTGRNSSFICRLVTRVACAPTLSAATTWPDAPRTGTAIERSPTSSSSSTSA